MSKKWIQIWYTWGDQECPVAVNESEDPWEKMKLLAINEAEFAFVENEDYGPAGLEFYKEEGRIVLHYPQDGEICYYQLTDKEVWDPDENQPVTYPRRD